MPRKSAIPTQKVALKQEAQTQKKLLSGVTLDSFQNFFAKLGIGTDNPASFVGYGFNPITRNRIQLEWAHRGSWLAGMMIDLIADDMTRGGIEMLGELKPEQLDQIEEAAVQWDVWGQIRRAIQWGRLYGGALLIPVVEGQAVETELLLDRVGKNQFKGLLVLDRWMVEPYLSQLVTKPGRYLGLPSSYLVTPRAPAFTGRRIHYSRAWRFLGIELPYQQALTENYWSISVIERAWDRMTSFDAATQGASQLAYKAHLRVFSIENLRDIIAGGGPALDGLVKMVDAMRRSQVNEGITLIDSKDKYEAHTHAAFTGLTDLVLMLLQQISGEEQIPLVRLLGQSPAGLNSTGESDLKTYYDGILSRQERMLRVPVTSVYRMLAAGLGINLPQGFKIKFKPLWQLSDKDRSEVAKANTDTVIQAVEAGLVSPKTGLMELRQQASLTGTWSNISDEEIDQASEEAAPPAQESDGEGGNLEAGDGTPVHIHDEAGWIEVTQEQFEKIVVGKSYNFGNGRIGRVIEKSQGDGSKSSAGWASGRPLIRVQWRTKDGLDRVPGKQAGYVELPGAKKDGDCSVVAVLGGISLQKGCCNNFQLGPNAETEEFKCGSCRFHEDEVRHQATSDSNLGQLAWHHGLQVVIETPQGQVRRGLGWEVRMPADYGYLRRAPGADGDELDCYVGPTPASTKVFLIDQVDPGTGVFDEHKVMLGYSSKQRAVEDYLLGFSDGSGPKRLGSVSELEMPVFKGWLQDGNLQVPFGKLQATEGRRV